MVKDLRDELKAQIEENKELEKKIDGLITVIHLARNYIKHPHYLESYYILSKYV